MPLEKDDEWRWENEQKEAFCKLKEILKNPPVLGNFNPNLPILLSVDATSTAYGGALIQNGHPIAYYSKSLTKTQINYSQIEKEALAILLACKKFPVYIWGNKNLIVESDHKPLETIFRKPLTEAPPRLQRILFEILPYPTIVYKKGTMLYIADILSRDCAKNVHDDEDENSFETCVIIPMSKTRLQQLKQETNTDIELVELKQQILVGWPDRISEVPASLRKYWSYRHELATYEDIIFKNDKIMIPPRLQEVVLKCCHFSHKGITGTL